MRTALKLCIGLLLLQNLVAQQPGPEVEMVDGKISISAQAVPLGRLLTLLDRATGMTSQVKPELANRPITVGFKGLELNAAIKKIFQSQPQVNYILIAGKGIRVTELADASGTASSAGSTSSPAFPSSQPINNSPIQPIGLPQAGPALQANPAQQGPINTPLGPYPAGPAPAATSTGPLTVPGQLPPPLGASNPLNNPTNPAGPTVTPQPGPTPSPGLPGAPPPGTLPR